MTDDITVKTTENVILESERNLELALYVEKAMRNIHKLARNVLEEVKKILDKRPGGWEIAVGPAGPDAFHLELNHPDWQEFLETRHKWGVLFATSSDSWDWEAAGISVERFKDDSSDFKKDIRKSFEQKVGPHNDGAAAHQLLCYLKDGHEDWTDLEDWSSLHFLKKAHSEPDSIAKKLADTLAKLAESVHMVSASRKAGP